MYWLAQAPSNIALIKYMGKKEGWGNQPDNASLSYTLNNLFSTVRLELLPGAIDSWEPLNTADTIPFSLSLAGQQRFIGHLNRLKDYFGYDGSFLIQSANNFPHSSGLASSASSFAALTKCAVLALSQLSKNPLPSLDEQASLSQKGSGSSCRSFYAPWALWQEDKVLAIELPYQELIHQVVVISNQEKKISSSEAHQRVKSSPLYSTRSKRAEDRLQALLAAARIKDWSSMYELCWAEFQDMHQLFHTCSSSFSYISPESQKVLNRLDDLWSRESDGPIVTMDAGPNIHLLYRPDQAALAHQFKSDYLAGIYEVL